MISCAAEYKKNLVNRSLLFLCIDKSKNTYCMEVTFDITNFQHLTGLKTDRSGINAAQFFNLCINKRLSLEHFDFATDGTTELKIRVLPIIVRKNLSANMLGNAYPALEGAVIHSDRGTQYTSESYRQTIREHHIHQSMNSAGGRCHDNDRCESMWARMKTELLYDRYDTKQMTVEELKVLILRYFLSYWNNRRICSANGGLPPMIKRRQYYETLELAA